MKKGLIVFVVALMLTVGITYLILVLKKQHEIERLERLTHIPNSEPHQHVSPDGDVASHTHIYDSPELLPPPEDTPVTKKTAAGGDTKDYMKTNNIQRIWAALDMDAIRAEFQPDTLEEVHEKWQHHFCVPPFTGRTVGTEGSPLTSVEELDILRPREAWIARLYEYGYPFSRADDYKGALSTRYSLKYYLDIADTIPPHEQVGLPAEATWEEIEETFLKHQVIAEIAFTRAERADPKNFSGGVYNISASGQGVLTPFHQNTVYVHVSEDKPFSKFTGVKLSASEEAALTMFGVAPAGVKVIYTDKDGIPLASDEKPRFYERAMAGLDAAESRVAKLIADHDALFQTADDIATPESTGDGVVPPDSHPHVHTHAHPSDREPQRGPDMSSFPPKDLDTRPPPDIPVLPRDPEQIEQWFTELLLLHAGDLPQDVKGLQQAIEVLSVIRARGESASDKPTKQKDAPASDKPPAPSRK